MFPIIAPSVVVALLVASVITVMATVASFVMMPLQSLFVAMMSLVPFISFTTVA
jgi:hypothetical protein